jgi:hypothetical protein
MLKNSYTFLKINDIDFQRPKIGIKLLAIAFILK